MGRGAARARAYGGNREESPSDVVTSLSKIHLWRLVAIRATAAERPVLTKQHGQTDGLARTKRPNGFLDVRRNGCRLCILVRRTPGMGPSKDGDGRTRIPHSRSRSSTFSYSSCSLTPRMLSPAESRGLMPPAGTEMKDVEAKVANRDSHWLVPCEKGLPSTHQLLIA